MYMITVDHSTIFHFWHLYRYIFFIWNHYFINFPYVCHAYCSIFFHYMCFFCKCVFLVDMSSGFTTTLQIIFCYKFYYDFLRHISYISIMYPYIYLYFSYVRMILFRYLSIFFICQDGYFHTNAFSVKLLNHFSLPDVASAIIPLVHIVSLVVSVSVTVAEHDEPNKVDFVFISIQGEFTQTLHWYSITNYSLLSFSYHIYL